jgi:hypothetical protein
MERNQDRPDVSFWTTYDHYVFERDARALRRRHARAAMRAFLRRAKAQIARALKHAGAQPVKPARSPA